MKNRVFEIFKEITAIPRGSGNMKQIADFCVAFAIKNSLKYLRDNVDNVIIFKNGTNESTEPIILQAHLDMVCQKTADSTHDFTKNSPEIVVDGDFIRANGTTLGADNGIGLALILAILESDTLSHPPIEAVFTINEEIGMIGALALDVSPLKSKRMINLDSEEDDTVTVSCAGGSEFLFSFPMESENYDGNVIVVTLSGLKGGHSGVEIDRGRVNANALAGRFLNHLYNLSDFRIISLNGGDKSNVISPECAITLATSDAEFTVKANEYLSLIKNEISSREPNFYFNINLDNKAVTAFTKSLTERIIFTLLNAPNGIIDMSADIEGLVETSLNIGILKTEENNVKIDFSLRSNKSSAMKFLEERLISFANFVKADAKSFGHYPPWEYKPNSKLQEIYVSEFRKHYGFEPKIEAIHAGLECGVFDGKLDGLTAISVGPQMYDVHTVNEKLSVSSTEKFIGLLIKVLQML
ncbi:MAG: beta-Ala-His dipeptidase [Clostridia bacterium]|nr:beta-Ala-His dipeptidase [Clostridia bacterium]